MPSEDIHSTTGRPAQEAIDLALDETWGPEVAVVSFCGVVVLAGVFCLCVGALRGDTVTALIGAVASALIWPAITQMVKIRHERSSLRLLGPILDRAATAQEAALIVRQHYLEPFVLPKDRRLER